MGIYNSFIDEGGSEIQLKVGECLLKEIKIGDSVENLGMEDGIYVAPEGIVIIKGQIYIGALKIYDKWGGEIDLKEPVESRNYIKIAVDELVNKKEY